MGNNCNDPCKIINTKNIDLVITLQSLVDPRNKIVTKELVK